MITIFNRRELLVTQSMARQAEAREILSQHNLKYSIKTINRRSPSPFGQVLVLIQVLLEKIPCLSMNISFM